MTPKSGVRAPDPPESAAESRACERGGRLRVVSDSPRIRRLLRASGLLGRFPPLPGIPGQRT
ncbi:STAS domain-containing protein [Streptomyces justiciae]|uniref:hypothetical protein n=1 Tax=Streptomyces justiciae TaxID=2780140 RepID=UPI003908B88E